jgi:serine/threonine-protein kinase
MSTVYKALAPVTNRLVALKILQPRNEIFADLIGVDKLRDMFVEEARVMGSISHDHIAKVLDCDFHEEQPFIVLEYFAHSIGAFIGEAYRIEDRSRTISVAKTKSYLIQALKGLERLHFSGIVHRDIKPFNLMLTSDDRVKIIDFGLSRVRGEEITQIPGMQIGTPYYAAPEQRRNPQAADGRADLYSLGVLAYRMLTGWLLDDGVRSLAERLSADLDPEWEACLGRSLAADPDERYQTAQEMRLAVERLPVPNGKVRVFASRQSEKSLSSLSLRVRPTRIMYRDIRDLLGLDSLFRPNSYHAQDFGVVEPLVAFDRSTNLLWQRRGAGFQLNWKQAWSYINHLNDSGWQGRNTWRLPTVEELFSILAPPLHEITCSSWPLFDSTIHWLWSADHCNKKQAWMVDVVESYFERLDLDGAASVCAVSSQ